MKLLFKTLLLATFVATIKADCDVCQLNNQVACRSKNTYSLCVNGVLTEDYITCPDDYICADGELICYHPNEATPSCSHDNELDDITTMLPVAMDGNQCGICDEDKVFACLSETTYGFCFGQETLLDGPVDLIMECPENTVCNINDKTDFCSDIAVSKSSCIPSLADNLETTTYEPETTTTEFPSTITTEVYTTTTEFEYTTTTEVQSTTTEALTTTTEEDFPTATTEEEDVQTTTTDDFETMTTEEFTTMQPSITDTTEKAFETTTTEKLTTTTEEDFPTETTEEDFPTATTEEEDGQTTTTDDFETMTTEEFTTMQPSITDTTETSFETTTTIAEGSTIDWTTIDPSSTEGPWTESTTMDPITITTTEEVSVITTTIDVPTSTTQTPVTPPRDAKQICLDHGASGQYKTDDDCTKFVMCFILNGTLDGLIKSCPSGQYFHDDLKLCMNVLPERCL
ncbi:uncharacterized protein [Musca autumnalis]|uniref:uncharacterized protein n=1 Tax=Musca autumnalis TaxID=221902 RepID=UPI003CF52DE9